jgi:RNA polymerase sigma factor (sigma-70 family)
LSETEESRFQNLIVPHLDSGYSLARWLMGNPVDARDVMQEASIKAFRFMGSLKKSESAKAWFFQIVRNSAYTWLKAKPDYLEIDDATPLVSNPDPEHLLIHNVGSEEVRKALEALPSRQREILILREFEELSYEEIARVLEVPEGTVMSRLARARQLLKTTLISQRGGKL